MMRTILKVALVMVGGHLLFGAALLVIGVNDQNFSFALSLLYYYVNYPAVWLHNLMGPTTNLGLVILLGLPQWIILSFIVGSIISLFRKKKVTLP